MNIRDKKLLMKYYTWKHSKLFGIPQEAELELEEKYIDEFIKELNEL